MATQTDIEDFMTPTAEKRQRETYSTTATVRKDSPETKVYRPNNSSPSTDNDSTKDDQRRKARGRVPEKQSATHNDPPILNEDSDSLSSMGDQLPEEPKEKATAYTDDQDKDKGMDDNKKDGKYDSKIREYTTQTTGITETVETEQRIKVKARRNPRERSKEKERTTEKSVTGKGRDKVGSDSVKEKKTEQRTATMKDKGKDKQSYSATLKKNPGPILSQFKAHRVLVTFSISKPDTKAKRTQALSKGLNKFLAAAKESAHKKRTVRVRKYSDHSAHSDADSREWIKEFDRKKAADLIHYTHGFYPSQPLRKGVFRFKLQLMIPTIDDPATFIENANELFAEKENWKVQDIDAQSLYDPKDVGWLFRSSWTMTSSSEFRLEVEKAIHKYHPDINIGAMNRLITPPGDYKYDKETAVTAVMISCNAEEYYQVYEALSLIYNGDNYPPFGIQLKFVPLKDHPEIKNNAVALQNLSIIIDRQRIYNSQVEHELSKQLAFPDEPTANGDTLRETLMKLSPRNASSEFDNAKLFLAITKRNTRDGDIFYYFTFHSAFAMEARSVVNNLGLFLRDELSLDPDVYCYPSAMRSSHKWDNQSRTCVNPTGTFLTSLVDLTADLKGKEEDKYKSPEIENDMTSKEGREFRRTVGIDDTETVRDMQEKRKAKHKVPTQVIEDDRSTRSEMSGLTNYSSASKASEHRKQLRSQVVDQQIALDEQKDEIERLRAALAKQKVEIQAQGSNDPTQEEVQIINSDLSKGSDEDISYSDESPSRRGDITLEKNNNPYRLPPVNKDEETYDVHRMYSFPVSSEGHEFIDEERKIPLYNTDIGSETFLDPHWKEIRSGPYKEMSFLARRKSLEGIAVFVSKCVSATAEETTVYAWHIEGKAYPVHSNNPYKDSIPKHLTHHLYSTAFRVEVSYPDIPEQESDMDFLEETYGEVPIHNPNRKEGYPIDHHWVKFFEGNFFEVSHKEYDYRQKGYSTLVSGTNCEGTNLSIYLWVEGLQEDGTVRYSEGRQWTNEEHEEHDGANSDNSKAHEDSQDSGQSTQSPVPGDNRVSFNHYHQVQKYSTSDGEFIGDEEDHSMDESDVNDKDGDDILSTEDNHGNDDSSSSKSSSESSSSSSSDSSSKSLSSESSSSSSSSSNSSRERKSTKKKSRHKMNSTKREHSSQHMSPTKETIVKRKSNMTDKMVKETQSMLKRKDESQATGGSPGQDG